MSIPKPAPVTKAAATVAMRDGDGDAMVPVAEDDLRDLFVAEMRAVDPKTLDDPGLWFGINQNVINAAPPYFRKPDRSLLEVLDRERWTKTLTQFEQLGLAPPKNLLINDGTADNYCIERYDVLSSDKHPVVIRYWALEIADNNGGTGPMGNAMEPRAQLLCKALTGHSFEYPYHFIFAHVMRLRPDAPERAPLVENEDELLGFGGMKKGFLKALPDVAPRPREARGEETVAISSGAGEDVSPPPAPTPAWNDDPQYRFGKIEPPPRPETPAPPEPAKCEPCEPDVPVSPGAYDGRDPPGHKTYFPEAEYIYPDGNVRTVPAGMYTQEEFIEKTMVEQTRWADAMEAVSRAQGYHPTSPSPLRREQFTKYASPLTRSPSEAEHISGAERLGADVVSASERARNVMAASDR